MCCWQFPVTSLTVGSCSTNVPQILIITQGPGRGMLEQFMISNEGKKKECSLEMLSPKLLVAFEMFLL